MVCSFYLAAPTAIPGWPHDNQSELGRLITFPSHKLKTWYWWWSRWYTIKINMVCSFPLAAPTAIPGWPHDNQSELGRLITFPSHKLKTWYWWWSRWYTIKINMVCSFPLAAPTAIPGWPHDNQSELGRLITFPSHKLKTWYWWWSWWYTIKINMVCSFPLAAPTAIPGWPHDNQSELGRLITFPSHKLKTWYWCDDHDDTQKKLIWFALFL